MFVPVPSVVLAKREQDAVTREHLSTGVCLPAKVQQLPRTRTGLKSILKATARVLLVSENPSCTSQSERDGVEPPPLCNDVCGLAVVVCHRVCLRPLLEKLSYDSQYLRMQLGIAGTNTMT